MRVRDYEPFVCYSVCSCRPSPRQYRLSLQACLARLHLPPPIETHGEGADDLWTNNSHSPHCYWKQRP